MLKSIETSPAISNKIVQAICVLYNFDIDESRRIRPEQLADRGDNENGIWRNAVGRAFGQAVQMRPLRANNPPAQARQVQEALKNYFVNAGSVTWQERSIEKFNF